MLPSPCASRRHFLSRGAFGLGAFGLAWLLKQDGLLAKPPDAGDAALRSAAEEAALRAAKRKAMISMFMQGGPSHIDLFDPKPELDKLDGKKFPGEVKYDDAARASRKVLGSARGNSQKHGQSGIDVSELLPALRRDRGRRHAHPRHADAA